MNALSDREQKLVAIALLMTLLTVIWMGAVSPWIGGFEARRERRATALTQLAQNARLIAGGPALRTALALRKRSAADAAFVAPSTAIGIDLARRRVLDAAEAANVQLSSLHSVAGSAQTLRLDAEVHGDLTRLTRFIQDLENATPCASIDEIVVNAANPDQPTTSALLEAHLAITYGLVAGDR